MKIPELMKQYRKKHGLSQEDLGKLMGVSKQAISMYERGTRSLDIGGIARFSEITNIDINVIFGKKEKKPADEGELSEDVIIYHRDGKTVKQQFTKKQMDTILMMIDAMVEKPKDI